MNDNKTEEHDAEADGLIDGIRELIPPGEYELEYLEHLTYPVCGRPNLVIRFRVCGESEARGKIVERFYNAKMLIGKQGVGGKFSVWPGSNFAFEFCRLFGDRLKRLDRIPMTLFKGSVVIGKVSTVTKNHRKQKTHPLQHYSKVEELIEIKPPF